jgi:RNA 2',3'-cyclic 3'-phosphodiesterase
MPPFDIAFDRATSLSVRGDKAPIALVGDDGVAGLSMFEQAFAAAMRRARFRCRTRPQFAPHVTLLYDRQRIQEQEVAPVRWTVRDVTLVHSLVGRGRHTLLGQWPLRR